MFFDYVDTITEYKKWNFIKGYKFFGNNELFYLCNGKSYINPMLILESIAQLGDWLIRYSSDFTKRTIPLILEKAQFVKHLNISQKIYIEAQITEIDEDIVTCKGSALAEDGSVIVRIDMCKGKTLDINEFYEPIDIKNQFNTKLKNEMNGNFHSEDSSKLYDKNLVLSDLNIKLEKPCGENLYFVDQVNFKNHSKVITQKFFSQDEPFFRWHFPKKSVLPGIFMLSTVMETAQLLMHSEHFTLQNNIFFLPSQIQRCVFRQFVTPNSLCQSICEKDIEFCSANTNQVKIKGIMQKDQKTVLKVDMIF